LTGHPVIQFLTLYGSYSFGLLYIVHTTYATLWIDRYHQPVSTSGLNFISIALGFILVAQIAGPISDRILQHLHKKPEATSSSLEDEPIKVVPEYRVPLMIPGALLIPPIGLLIYGWTAQKETHWIGPNIGIAIFSAGINIGGQCQTAYLVDAYPEFTASALEASSVMKIVAGFGFPLFAPSLYDKLDYGWGNTLLAGIAVILGLPMPRIWWNYGARLSAKGTTIL
jgi:MFS family permease